MDSISYNIYNFIYIAVIILGGVTLTLTVILRARERDRQHGAICMFAGSIFVYMLTDFITYYYLGENVSGNLVFSLITLSDILFCVLVTAWVHLIAVQFREEPAVTKKVIALSAVYIVASQILSIDLGRYDSYAIHVESGAGKTALQIMNAAYALIIILIGIRFMYLLVTRYKSGGSRNVNIIMVVLLIGYMLWTAYWDYSIWYKTEENLIDIYAMDPLILLYAILNGFLIYYFYKKDPLHLSESQVAPEDAIDVIAARYELSDREKEVLDHINKGRSNKQIAVELSISENTVKRHVNNIFRKTETQGRHEIIFKISNVTGNEVKNRGEK
ncbi:MAG: LuxR C-terminal-related transcriptional regulator [Bacillota bacterium]|nr:LuxR C-terminal-related transcriptional regulator [Bacillota bacterium]